MSDRNRRGRKSFPAIAVRRTSEMAASAEIESKTSHKNASGYGPMSLRLHARRSTICVGWAFLLRRRGIYADIWNGSALSEIRWFFAIFPTRRLHIFGNSASKMAEIPEISRFLACRKGRIFSIEKTEKIRTFCLRISSALRRIFLMLFAAAVSVRDPLGLFVKRLPRSLPFPFGRDGRP